MLPSMPKGSYYMQKNVVNVLLAGVGGQGILKLSDILSKVAAEAGYDVKKSEVHGMAQRGGTVTSHIRFGQKVYSPLIPKGEADFIVALEQLEALRYANYIRNDGILLYDPMQIEPPEVYTGVRDYPADIPEQLKEFVKDIKPVPAFECALKLKNPRIQNIVIIGALSKFLDIDEKLYEKVIINSFPERFREINLRAFREGRKL